MKAPRGGAELTVVCLVVVLLAPGITRGSTTDRFSYDAAGRVSRVEHGDGTVIDYTYDLAGNRLMWRCSAPGAPANTQPTEPCDPGIPDGATGVSIVPTMTWNGGDPDEGDAVVYSIYLGAAGDTVLVYTGGSTSFTPSNLLSMTTYAWQVVSRDSRGASTTGPTWGFTTGNAPPVADFDATPTFGWAPLTVAFFDLSTDPGDAVVGWEWDFESDGTFDSSDRNPNCTYPASGKYSVTLRVTDSHGATAIRTRVEFIEHLG